VNSGVGVNRRGRSAIVVIGIGAEMRGDDGLGPAAADLLTEQLDPDEGVEVITLDGEPTRLIEEWRGRDLVVVIDAVRRGGVGGALHRIEFDDVIGVDRGPSASSHHGGLAEAVALGEILERLPHELVVHGIEPVDMSTGSDLSPEVRSALPRLVDAVIAEVRR